ncbi:hypothetical protein PIB30_035601 [Stylosanthes scabra]|uniref:Uncharacterized protein n=1 Tax=Stylosanthes scabra TaxID=79078 RepID=A0ABU6XDZ1_9FABA|nr:hypothetical protein [Stylosanthes scabra]
MVVDESRPGIRFVSLFMLGSYLFFYFGYACYYHEKLLPESNVGKFYRVCRAAYRKRNLAYLTSSSADGYYWKNYKQGHLYEAKDGRVVMLLPRVPWGFRWLDKAAIIDACTEEQSENQDVISPYMQEMKGVLCSVKKVRETKSIAVLLCWGFSLFPYSFVAASGNSFFVSQAIDLKRVTTNDISLLFLLKSFVRDMATPLFFKIVKKAKIAKKINEIVIVNFGGKRKLIDSTTMKIGIGMFAAAICCVFAWNVEEHRGEWIGVMSRKVMIPQFVLLGMAEALVGDGLSKLFERYAWESVSNFAEPYSNLVTGIGKLLSIPWYLIFRGWVNQSYGTSHLDRYFLMLAILNLVFLLIFLFYYYMFVHNNEFPENQEEEEAAASETSQELEVPIN